MNLPTIDKARYFEEIGYSPHGGGQKLIHDSTARFVIPTCGRRWGKSQAAGREIGWRLFAPDTYMWIVGPTYTLGEKEFRVVYNDIVRKLGRKIKGIRKSYNVKQGDMRIEMPWNTVLEVKSAEKQDGLVGEGLDYCCVSEAALHLMSTWQQFIEPALADRQGGAIFPSTPRGNNWYKGLWQLGQSSLDPEYKSWRFPTWTNDAVFEGGFDPLCPNILGNISGGIRKHINNKVKCTCNKELVRIFNQVTEHYWLQEYGAEFTSFEGKIYPDFSVDTHVKRMPYVPEWKNVCAYDFGFADPFVCLDIMIDPEDNVYVWREYQNRYLTTWEHAQVLKMRENPQGYHVDWAAADPRNPDGIRTLQFILNQSISANAQMWDVGVEAVGRWVRKQANGKPKLFIHPSCNELIRQMEELKVRATKEGKNHREGQHDYDDHGPDALRYFFNEWQVAGLNVSLSDVYPGSYRGSEAETYFKLNTGISIDTPVGYY